MGRHLTAQSTAADAKVKKLGGDSGAWVGEMAFLDRMGEKELEKRRPKPPLTEKGSVALPKPDESQSHPETKVPKNGPETTASQQSKTAHVLYTVLAKEDCTVWRWSFDEMEALIESSTVSRNYYFASNEEQQLRRDSP